MPLSCSVPGARATRCVGGIAEASGSDRTKDTSETETAELLSRPGPRGIRAFDKSPGRWPGLWWGAPFRGWKGMNSGKTPDRCLPSAPKSGYECEQKRSLQNHLLAGPILQSLRHRNGPDVQHRRRILAARECQYPVATEDESPSVRRVRQKGKTFSTSSGR
jgi:hypothetical protein